MNPLARLRRWLRMIRAVLARPGAASSGHPGMTAFPKRIFELPPSAPPAPGGQSRAYIELAVSLRRTERLRRTTPPSAREAWLQRLHLAVLEAHRLERELLSRLEDGR